MRRVERDWLGRVPGWVGSDGPPRKRPVRRPAEDGEPAAGGPGDPDAEGEPAAEDADGQGAEDAQDAAPGAGDAEPDADGEQAGENAPEELGLEMPEEVEQRRREEEAKRRNTPRNPGMAPQAFGLEGHYLRNLATRFARMIAKVAEDSADLPTEGDDEWDMNELIRRRFTGRLLSQCRMTREKRKVAVVLDTSPSCEHQARLFASIARIAQELGDCELFDAPNFVMTARQADGGGWEPLPEDARAWDFRGRVVLAFGDFDGIDRICAASRVRGNRIYWFCCEERPSVLEHGRETFVKDYRGHYFTANHLGQLMQALRRVR